MNITETVHEWDAAAAPRYATITIKLDPGDDPYGAIHGLVVSGRLAAVLRAVGDRARFGDPSPGAEVAELLTHLAAFCRQVDDALDDLMHMARDQHGYSLRDLASMVGVAPNTVRRRVALTRHRLAQSGRYRDESGLHETSRRRAIERAVEMD